MYTPLRHWKSALILAVTLSAQQASALNVTLGDVRARNLGSYGFTATNSELSFDSGTTDQLYQMYGYLGNATDTVAINGTYFSVASAIAQTSPGVAESSLLLNGAGATALGLAAGDIRIDYVFRLINDTSPFDLDSFRWDVSIANLGSGSVSLSMYQYLDLDLNGTANDDLASGSGSQIVVADGTAPFVFAWNAANGSPADHFAVQAYPGLRNLLDGMAAAQDLPDTATSFGPADFTGAFQYDFVLAPGGSIDLVGGAVTVPEPAPALLALLGLIGLAAASRRRARREGEPREAALRPSRETATQTRSHVSPSRACAGSHGSLAWAASTIRLGSAK